MNKEIKKLAKRLNAMPGVEVRVTPGKQHAKVYLHGAPVWSLPATPGDHRAMRNLLSDLRKKGIPV